MERIVLHVDVDAFFCQVEVLRKPELKGRAIAIQQHQDIIAVNYLARDAGVKKHMSPQKARELLAPLGGCLVHVFTEEGLRVSYRPYREMSQALMRLLKQFPSAAVVQKASIDEAFILCRPPGDHPPYDVSVGVELATAIRDAAMQKLGLVVSVGVAGNPLLAKLASSASKPDGLKVVAEPEQVQQLLQSTPVKKLPGMGGRVADALSQAGVGSVWSLQSFSPQELAAATGLKPELAARLVEYGHGRDAAEVVDKGPPKSIQVQMTLSPVPLPMPASHAAESSVTGGQVGMLVPLPAEMCTELELTDCLEAQASADKGAQDAGQPELADSIKALTFRPIYTMHARPPEPPPAAGDPGSFPRLQMLLRAMSSDLVSRTLMDRHFEGRWPTKLSLQLISHGPQGKTTSKSTAFPSAALDQGNGPLAMRQERPTAGATAASIPAGAADAAATTLPESGDRTLLVGERTFTPSNALLDALSDANSSLAQAMLPLHAPSSPLVQVHLAASSFQPLQPSAAAPRITSFFTALARAGPQADAAGPSAERRQQQPPNQADSTDIPTPAAATAGAGTNFVRKRTGSGFIDATDGQSKKQRGLPDDAASASRAAGEALQAPEGNHAVAEQQRGDQLQQSAHGLQHDHQLQPQRHRSDLHSRHAPAAEPDKPAADHMQNPATLSSGNLGNGKEAGGSHSGTAVRRDMHVLGPRGGLPLLSLLQQLPVGPAPAAEHAWAAASHALDDRLRQLGLSRVLL